MNLSLLLVGLLKAVFGIVVGAGGIYAASRALHRLLGAGAGDDAQKRGNVAVAVLEAASLLALGLLLQRAVVSTFDAMDLMYRDADITADALRRIAIYATVHVGLSLLVSASVLALGTYLFTKLTRGVDEVAEIRKGNLAPALVLSAVMVVLALMTAPGLEMALEGLIPLPQLARDEVLGPA
jgi:uncharacterized membrane protein YjfL (UPF0719 family)